jgi:hypothetical protein
VTLTPVKTELNKSLEQLEQESWGEPSFDSGLVRRCHYLRTVPLRDLKAGDLRVLICQNISLQRLVPLALDLLDRDPLTDAELSEGDLLLALLHAEPEFWHRHPPFRSRLSGISHRALALLEADPEAYVFADAKLLRESHAKFHQRNAQ